MSAQLPCRRSTPIVCGTVEATARITGIREGVVFVPFHYGYGDEAEGSEPNGRARAANELTITRWDPVSKQPIYKTAAVRVEKLSDEFRRAGQSEPRPTRGGQMGKTIVTRVSRVRLDHPGPPAKRCAKRRGALIITKEGDRKWLPTR